MGFLGPVTRLGGALTRPHDIDVSTTAVASAHAGTVERVTSLGFEIRLLVKTANDAEPVTVQLSRGQAQELDLKVGDPVWLRTYRGTPVQPATTSSSAAATA
jgi:sulfate transport system ATP-binding protein